MNTLNRCPTLTESFRLYARCGVIAAIFTFANAAPSWSGCRQALAIGLDISGSVDAREYRLQLDGLAGALLERDVQDAFFAMPQNHVRLYVYEWGGQLSQRVLLRWTKVVSPDDLISIADILRSTSRQPLEPNTALGKAMAFGASALASQPECWRQTMDLSGDGKSNAGPAPGDVRAMPALADITINALVIGADAAPFSDEINSEINGLVRYFQAEVIRGPDAFVQAAIEFSEFQDAMAKKLLKELQTRAVGSVILKKP